MPIQSLALKLDTSKEWQIYQEVIAKIQNKVDIFRLVKNRKADNEGFENDNQSNLSNNDWNY